MPVILHLLLTLAVRPDLIITIKRWCALHLLLGHISAVALEVFGIGELIPRDGAVVNTDAEKPAKRHIDVEGTPMKDEPVFS